MWITCGVAWRPGVVHHRGLLIWFGKGCVSQFGLVRGCISLVPRYTSSVIPVFATALLAAFPGCLSRRFGAGLVKQIDCELLAQSLCRQQQLLWERRSPPETRSLSDLSVPPTL
jgi:hypothetical protein